jgi:ketosteroid isomerase-like protein
LVISNLTHHGAEGGIDQAVGVGGGIESGGDEFTEQGGHRSWAAGEGIDALKRGVGAEPAGDRVDLGEQAHQVLAGRRERRRIGDDQAHRAAPGASRERCVRHDPWLPPDDEPLPDETPLEVDELVPLDELESVVPLVELVPVVPLVPDVVDVSVESVLVVVEVVEVLAASALAAWPTATTRPTVRATPATAELAPSTAARRSSPLETFGAFIPKTMSFGALRRCQRTIKRFLNPDVAGPRGAPIPGYEAFAKGDLATVTGLFARDIVWTIPGNSAIAGEYNGTEEILGFFANLMGSSGGTFSLPLNHLLASDDRVVALCSQSAERNGQTLDADLVHVWHLADGKVTQFWGIPYDAATGDAFWS